MKDQLINYVELLFAGSSDSGEIKQEILQNTLDRYDDLIAQGKSPQAAYSLSISGIGDVSELLVQKGSATADPDFKESHEVTGKEEERKKQRAAAIAFYILCPVPLFILSDFGLDTLGLCLTLLLIAAATALIIIAGNKKPIETESSYEYPNPGQPASRRELRGSIRAMIWAVGLGVYFIMSFMTGAWYLTWLVFPITACTSGLVNACMDLKEAN